VTDAPPPVPADLSSTTVPTVGASELAARTGGRVLRLDGLPGGGDPLVRRYLDRNLATCAYTTVSWWWLVFGAVFAVGGARLGQLIAQRAGVPSPNLRPWIEWLGRDDWLAGLARTLHLHFGIEWASLLGLLAGTALCALLGLVVRLRGVATAHEPWLVAPFLVLAYLAVVDGQVFVSVLTGVVALIYLAAIAFRLLALAAGGRRGIRHDRLDEPAGGWPVYTVLVPLYKERNVARNILASLTRLDYPRDRLDVKFLLEADDPETLPALEAAGIPPWAEVLVAPLGQPKTKPRACNHGLETARGEYLVIFDAEDRPDSDQLKQAVLAFRSLASIAAARGRPDRVACLQAQLAYHNHDQNLLTRWFALEYNVWFGRYLAGLERLGVPMPLGGTSNHFRTAPLQALGGWDPFNVTEDCDLGVRLRMTGLRTRMLDSVTWEEANSRTGNWLRQRSRWLKGYLITHLVWFRRPLRLFWRLNPWGAVGFVFSVFSVAALAALNLPLWIMTAIYVWMLGVDWSHGHGSVWQLLTERPMTWAVSFIERDGVQVVGGVHRRVSWPMIYTGPGESETWSQISVVLFVASCCLLVGNLMFVFVNLIAGRRPGQRGLWWAALISPLYWVLLSLAAWKAIWQMLVRPHYWEKTVHGLDQPPPPAAPEPQVGTATVARPVPPV